jgi:hypothetical protein
MRNSSEMSCLMSGQNDSSSRKRAQLKNVKSIKFIISSNMLNLPNSLGVVAPRDDS